MTTQQEFEKEALGSKYNLLKEQGDFVGSRVFESYNIHLFSMGGYYVEMWRKLGLNHIYWIDVVKDEKVLDKYLDNIDINSITNGVV